METFVSVIYVKVIFIKIYIPQYYLFSLLYFYIGSFLLNIIYIKKIYIKRLFVKMEQKFFWGVYPSLFLKFHFTQAILINKNVHTKGIFRASAMPWMKLFETLVNGLSIFDYCRRKLGWEGPRSGSENKCRNRLFIKINFQVRLRILSTFKSALNHLQISQVFQELFRNNTFQIKL